MFGAASLNLFSFYPRGTLQIISRSRGTPNKTNPSWISGKMPIHMVPTGDAMLVEKPQRGATFQKQTTAREIVFGAASHNLYYPRGTLKIIFRFQGTADKTIPHGSMGKCLLSWRQLVVSAL